MHEEEFSKLIKKDVCQVFLFKSRMSFPLTFATHSWIVTNNKGNISRWEIWGYKNRCKTSWYYLHLNLYEPWVGVKKFIGKNANPSAPRFKGELVSSIEGDRGSLAEKIVSFMTKNSINYPLRNRFNLFFGPNCNTFTQWIIDNFPESGFKLPITAYGKGYAKRITKNSAFH